MIILNNRIFSCEQCLLLKQGQKCEHVMNVLVSVEQFNLTVTDLSMAGGTTTVEIQTQSGNAAKKPKDFVQHITGQYRFVLAKAPYVLKAVKLSEHEDDEVLFLKSLNVDISKPVGACILLLEPDTNLFLLPTSYNLESISKQKVYNFSNVPIYSDDPQLLMYQSKDSAPMIPTSAALREGKASLPAPIVIRPLSHTRTKSGNHGNSMRFISSQRIPVEDLSIYPLFDGVYGLSDLRNLNNVPGPSCSLEKSKSSNVKRTPRASKVDIEGHSKQSYIDELDQFLKETQEFISHYCTNSTNIL